MLRFYTMPFGYANLFATLLCPCDIVMFWCYATLLNLYSMPLCYQQCYTPLVFFFAMLCHSAKPTKVSYTNCHDDNLGTLIYH
jgi:hypothetical protein